MSKKREDTFRGSAWKVFMSLTRMRQALYMVGPGSELNWLGCIGPFGRVARRRRVVTILSRILETVRRRSIIVNEVGDW